MAKRDDKKAVGEDKVGYGRPPKHSQFKKGTSGNPSGRPRAVDTIPGIVEKIANQKIPVTIGNRMRHIPMIEAAVMKLSLEALKGNPRAVKLFLELCEKTKAFEKPLLIRVEYIDPQDPGSSSTSE